MTGKTFSTMKTNVGNFIQDTSNDTASLIGVWLNDAYQDAWRRCMWTDVIDEDFTFTSTADKDDYSFSTDLGITDFGEELFVADITNGHILDRWSIREWIQKRAKSYDSGSLDSGNPVRYVILPEAGNIRLDPPPDTGSETYAMPYKKEVSDMSDDSDTPEITTISTYLESYAIGMGLAYNRQYQKASWFQNKAEFELKKLIKQERVKVNQIYQRKLTGRKIKTRGRFVERAYG